jgi:2-polyprenyl-6-hydroxyphenyl methylase/3-demethylubiquinone-9 3-methyltransferase
MYLGHIINYAETSARGMSYWHDVVDWIGGYPFEVAKPEEVFHFYRRRGFVLRQLKTCAGSIGCNEFVFEKAEPGSAMLGNSTVRHYCGR